MATQHPAWLLFDALLRPVKPKEQTLSHRLEPTSFDDFPGQEHLLGPQGLLRTLLNEKEWPSLLLAGQPGWGVRQLTKLVGIEAQRRGHKMLRLADKLTAAELKRLMEESEQRALQGQCTVLYTGELHKRFRPPKQDIIAPYVKGGIVYLLCLATEEDGDLTAQLRAVVSVLKLRPLEEEHLCRLLEEVEKKLARKLPLERDARALLVRMAEGDQGFLLRFCDRLAEFPAVLRLTADALQNGALLALLYRSLAASDAKSALCALACAMRAGLEAQAIGRLLIRFAAVEVGPADPSALGYAVAATQTAALLGVEEASAALAGAVMRLAGAPKSRLAAESYAQAAEEVEKLPAEYPPREMLKRHLLGKS